MNRTSLDFLFRLEAPWVSIGPLEPERIKWVPSFFYAREGLSVCVRRLRGQKMRTTEGLMTEFGAALQFFDGFGENWHALEECLGYLDEWLPAQSYVLVVERAEETLCESGLGAMIALLKVLHATGEFWSRPITDGGRFDRPGVPFHVLFNLSSSAVGIESELVRSAAHAGIPIRY